MSDMETFRWLNKEERRGRRREEREREREGGEERRGRRREERRGRRRPHSGNRWKIPLLRSEHRGAVLHGRRYVPTRIPPKQTQIPEMKLFFYQQEWNTEELWTVFTSATLQETLFTPTHAGIFTLVTALKGQLHLFFNRGCQVLKR